MTKEEALKIVNLQIFPNDILTDFYLYQMAKRHKLSKPSARKAIQGIRNHWDNPDREGYLFIADRMVDNLEKYGVPCADWCE